MSVVIYSFINSLRILLLVPAMYQPGVQSSDDGTQSTLLERKNQEEEMDRHSFHP